MPESACESLPRAHGSSTCRLLTALTAVALTLAVSAPAWADGSLHRFRMKEHRPELRIRGHRLHEAPAHALDQLQDPRRPVALVGWRIPSLHETSSAWLPSLAANPGRHLAARALRGPAGGCDRRSADDADALATVLDPGLEGRRGDPAPSAANQSRRNRLAASSVGRPTRRRASGHRSHSVALARWSSTSASSAPTCRSTRVNPAPIAGPKVDEGYDALDALAEELASALVAVVGGEGPVTRRPAVGER